MGLGWVRSDRTRFVPRPGAACGDACKAMMAAASSNLSRCRPNRSCSGRVVGHRCLHCLEAHQAGRGQERGGGGRRRVKRGRSYAVIHLVIYSFVGFQVRSSPKSNQTKQMRYAGCGAMGTQKTIRSPRARASTNKQGAAWGADSSNTIPKKKQPKPCVCTVRGSRGHVYVFKRAFLPSLLFL